MELDYWEARFNELFPDGLTQEQIEEANREMWKDNKFYCGKCGFLPISDYPHDCPKQGGGKRWVI